MDRIYRQIKKEDMTFKIALDESPNVTDKRYCEAIKDKIFQYEIYINDNLVACEGDYYITEFEDFDKMVYQMLKDSENEDMLKGGLITY